MSVFNSRVRCTDYLGFIILVTAFILTVNVPKSQPHPQSMLLTNLSSINRRKPRSCVVKSDVDLNKLRSVVQKSGRVSKERLISYDDQGKYLFSFGKKGCKTSQSLCTCRNKIKFSMFPFPQFPLLQAIRGGLFVPLGAIPWMVKVEMPISGKHCVGVMISYVFVLTAAHCLDGEPNAKFTFGLNSGSTPNISNVMAFSVDKSHFYIHPWYSRRLLKADSNLVLVHFLYDANDKIRLVNNPAVAPACLPTRPPMEKDLCFMTSWSKKSPTSSNDPVNFSELTWLRVTANYITDTYNIWTSSDFADRPSGACQGDSGAPMMCLYTDGTFKVVGLFTERFPETIADGCDSRKTPNLFTDIFLHMKFFNDTMDDILDAYPLLA